MREDDLNEESEGNIVNANEEISPSEPGLDFDDYDKIQNMWQKNLEIETTSWLVVPLMVFSDPDVHSTTAKC